MEAVYEKEKKNWENFELRGKESVTANEQIKNPPPGAFVRLKAIATDPKEAVAFERSSERSSVPS